MTGVVGPFTRTLGSSADYPLRDQVRDAIQSRIEDGTFPPGYRLTEQTLADEFSVSRIPIREAIRMLQSEGFVQSIPRRGAVVTTLSRADLEDLYDVRMALEGLTFELAAQRASAADLEQLAQLLAAARTASTGPGRDHAEMIRLNVAFHEEVSALAANPVLSDLYRPLNGRIRLLMGRSHEYDRELVEHAELLAALRSRDPERAGSLARAHIKTSKMHELAQFDAKRDGSE